MELFHCNVKLFSNLPFYKSCDHKELSVDSRKLPGRLNSKDEHSRLLDLKSIFKQHEHIIRQPDSLA